MNEKKVLENAYCIAQTIDNGTIDAQIIENVDVLIAKIDNNKSLVSALTTSLVKKIIYPQQDVRLHRTDFEGGYSARVLDTQFTSPFFKEKFPRYANKESAFLTLATRERIKWSKEEGNNLKIRDVKLKNAFLNIFEQIEANEIKPEHCLYYLFSQLIKLSVQNEAIFKQVEKPISGIVNIATVIHILEEHFASKQSSRLPVIAIYSMYEILLPITTRYKHKILLPLQVHTASDKHGFGDIEICEQDGTPFESVEIKHNIPIDKYLIFDIVKKIRNNPIKRYYILTTYKNSFIDTATEKETNEYILQIKSQNGIDIIANGIITTLKYYLRFIDDYTLFIETYTKNLIEDAKKSTEVKDFHIIEWAEILHTYQLSL
jgi:DNA (cytosine-5)-methyltransferase 1